MYPLPVTGASRADQVAGKRAAGLMPRGLGLKSDCVRPRLDPGLGPRPSHPGHLGQEPLLQGSPWTAQSLPLALSRGRPEREGQGLPASRLPSCWLRAETTRNSLWAAPEKAEPGCGRSARPEGTALELPQHLVQRGAASTAGRKACRRRLPSLRDSPRFWPPPGSPHLLLGGPQLCGD